MGLIKGTKPPIEASNTGLRQQAAEAAVGTAAQSSGALQPASQDRYQAATSCTQQLLPSEQPLAGKRVVTDAFSAINPMAHVIPSLAAKMSPQQ